MIEETCANCGHGKDGEIQRHVFTRVKMEIMIVYAKNSNLKSQYY